MPRVLGGSACWGVLWVPWALCVSGELWEGPGGRTHWQLLGPSWHLLGRRGASKRPANPQVGVRFISLMRGQLILLHQARL